MKRFKDILRDLRRESGLTGEQLADLVGVKRYNISDWENGRNFPNFESGVRLAKVFNVSPDYLLGKTIIKNKIIPLDVNDEKSMIKKESINIVSQLLSQFGLVPVDRDITRDEVESLSNTLKELLAFKKIKEAMASELTAKKEPN